MYVGDIAPKLLYEGPFGKREKRREGGNKHDPVQTLISF